MLVGSDPLLRRTTPVVPAPSWTDYSLGEPSVACPVHEGTRDTTAETNSLPGGYNQMVGGDQADGCLCPATPPRQGEMTISASQDTPRQDLDMNTLP